MRDARAAANAFRIAVLISELFIICVKHKRLVMLWYDYADHFRLIWAFVLFDVVVTLSLARSIALCCVCQEFERAHIFFLCQFANWPFGSIISKHFVMVRMGKKRRQFAGIVSNRYEFEKFSNAKNSNTRNVFDQESWVVVASHFRRRNSFFFSLCSDCQEIDIVTALSSHWIFNKL